MGFFYSVRGWLEMDDEHCGQLSHMIQMDEDDLGHYRESWHIPAHGGGGPKFAFFGCLVRDSALPCIRQQFQRIATNVYSQDGDITDFVSGLVHVTAEDESHNLVWVCRHGRFSEKENEGVYH